VVIGMPRSSLNLSLPANIFVEVRDPGCHIIPGNKEYREEFSPQREKFLPGSGPRKLAVMAEEKGKWI
jgi:hypothetical protein